MPSSRNHQPENCSASYLWWGAWREARWGHPVGWNPPRWPGTPSCRRRTPGWPSLSGASSRRPCRWPTRTCPGACLWAGGPSARCTDPWDPGFYTWAWRRRRPRPPGRTPGSRGIAAHRLRAGPSPRPGWRSLSSLPFLMDRLSCSLKFLPHDDRWIDPRNNSLSLSLSAIMIDRWLRCFELSSCKPDPFAKKKRKKKKKENVQLRGSWTLSRSPATDKST